MEQGPSYSGIPLFYREPGYCTGFSRSCERIGEMGRMVALCVRCAHLVHRTITQFVLDGNTLAFGQRRQAELGRVRFVVELLSFFTPSNESLKGSLIAAF